MGMNYLAKLDAGESAVRPTRTRTREWLDDETIDELIPDPGSRIGVISSRTDHERLRIEAECREVWAEYREPQASAWG